MIKFLSYTFLTVLTVDLLATSGDITITWTSPIIPKLYSNDSTINPFDKPITEDEESWIGSLINIGAMIGPLPYSFIAEKLGRKVALLCIAIPHIGSYLVLAFSNSVYYYYCARLLGGIAVGGGYTILPMYIAEVAEDSNRGMLSVTLNIFWTFGNLLSYIIGPYLSIMWFNIILSCIPASFFVLLLLIAPETPYFLISRNKKEQAVKSLMLLRSSNKRQAEKEVEHIKSGLQKHDEDNSLMDLFKTRIYLKALMISLVLIMASQLSGINAVLFYTQQIFEAAGVNGIPADISSIIIGLVIFASSFTTPFVADRLGRRLPLLISCLGMTLAHALFGVYFYLKINTNSDVSSIFWLPLVSLVAYIVTFNFGVGPLPWTVSSELFPASVKSLAASLASFTCWFTSFLVTKFFNDLNYGMGKAGTFWLFGGFCLAACVFTYYFVPETKGKTFKEIQEILEK